MNTDLATRLRDHARDAALFPEPGRVLLAVSGGPDSLAMLDLMVRVAPELEIQLAVAHVDHGIADESPDVAEHVLGLAVRYNLPGYLVTLKLGRTASETAARSGRYAALRSMQQRTGSRYLATAHHADDQIETILLRIFRGTGVAGLAGIPDTGPGGLVRPLLPFRKEELADWLAPMHQRLLPHLDPANADMRHDRSWVREELLPLVRSRFGRAVDGWLLDVGRHAAAERHAWSTTLRVVRELDFRSSRGVAEVARAPLLEYDNALSEVLLRALAREVGCVLGPRRAARLWAFAQHASSGRTFDLGQHWVAEIAFGRLRIFKLKKETGNADHPSVPWGEGDEGWVQWGGWEIRWVHEPAGAPVRDSLVTWVTPGLGEIRSWMPGDRIRPFGGVGRRRVSRVLMEGKIPRSERATYPLVARAGRVIWLPGICRSDAAVPSVGEPAIRLEARDGPAT